jgi:hypothetical protein
LEVAHRQVRSRRCEEIERGGFDRATAVHESSIAAPRWRRGEPTITTAIADDEDVVKLHVALDRTRSTIHLGEDRG